MNINQHTFVKINLQARNSLKKNKSRSHYMNITPTFLSQNWSIVNKLKLRNLHWIISPNLITRKKANFHHIRHNNIQPFSQWWSHVRTGGSTTTLSLRSLMETTILPLKLEENYNYQFNFFLLLKSDSDSIYSL